MYRLAVRLALPCPNALAQALLVGFSVVAAVPPIGEAESHDVEPRGCVRTGPVDTAAAPVTRIPAQSQRCFLFGPFREMEIA